LVLTNRHCVVGWQEIEPACAQQPTKQFDAYFGVNAPDPQAVAVAVYRDGKIIFVKGWGWPIGRERPYNAETVWMSVRFRSNSRRPDLLLKRQGKLRPM